MPFVFSPINMFLVFSRSLRTCGYSIPPLTILITLIQYLNLNQCVLKNMFLVILSRPFHAKVTVKLKTVKKSGKLVSFLSLSLSSLDILCQLI